MPTLHNETGIPLVVAGAQIAVGNSATVADYAAIEAGDSTLYYAGNDEVDNGVIRLRAVVGGALVAERSTSPFPVLLVAAAVAVFLAVLLVVAVLRKSVARATPRVVPRSGSSWH